MDTLESYLLGRLRDVVVTQGVLLFFSNPTGVWAVVFGNLLGIFYDKFVVPAIILGERKGLLYYDKAVGALYAKKMEHAQETGDLDDWHDALGGL